MFYLHGDISTRRSRVKATGEFLPGYSLDLGSGLSSTANRSRISEHPKAQVQS